jgi:1-acyl-sn-glycerol-3-phosphate acyltransferase
MKFIKSAWTQIISKGFLVFMVTSFVPLFIIAFTIFLLTFLFDRNLVILQRFSCFWGSLYTWLMPRWHVTTINRKKIKPRQTYVVICNHQSLLDILVIYRLFFHFKFVSKSELFHIPFMGWNMVINRYIRIARGSKSSIKKMMNTCEKTLIRGSSILFFPEGTRSEDGAMKSFKQGAFVLAKKLSLPILPIVISGTHDALPKHKFTVKGNYHIKIQVLDEIDTDIVSKHGIEELVALAHGKMKEALIAI